VAAGASVCNRENPVTPAPGLFFLSEELDGERGCNADSQQ